jgi:GNAT superfamily N-acetyltransferase
MTELLEISKEQINCIRNLWEKLNRMHYEDSVYFEDHFASLDFEERKKDILAHGEEDVKITVAKDGPRFLGYCVSSVSGARGEIDSLYLEEELRGRGIGRKLVERHVEWMKSKGCAAIRAAVSYGHESVVDFYHRMGFFERVVYLELKDEG